MSLGAGDNNESVQTVSTARTICFAFQSEDKRTRKQALIDLEKYLANPDEDFSQQDLQTIFNETHIFTLKVFRDKTEAVRSQAIKFMSSFLLEKLVKNDYYLTYIFPVLVERIGTAELVEDSEEVRLELLQFLQAILTKYSNTPQLKPFLNDCVTILCETVKDKHPEVKELSCKCITNLAEALPRDFHMQSESLVKPVLTCFGYQRYKIRVEAVKCMGDIVMHSSYKAIEEASGPMAERLFDQIPAVRQMVAQVAARWLLTYRDRYSFFHKLLPLIMTGLNDEIVETREKAHNLWQIIGLQYEQENEKDLKDQMDYLTTPPKYYPEHLKRPNLGCRHLVQRSICKLASALARELNSWQGDVRVRCSQLLCAIALHAENYLTQHLQDLLPAMYFAARDEDQRVVVNVIQASEFIGLFVPVETWTQLILPAIEDGPHYGQFTILAGLIKGAPQEYLLPYLVEICKLLASDAVCQSRKGKYQQQLIKCVREILSKCNQNLFEVGEYLFTIIVTVISLRDQQNIDLINVSLLDDLYKTLEFESRYDVWSKYTKHLLQHINRDPMSWSSITVERCIFETVLLESGQAFGENLSLIGDILEQTLNPEADAESRLRTFVALSTALDLKDEVFKNAVGLDDFLQKLLTDVLVPTLVWHAGRTAEAMRTMALSCVCSAFNPGTQVDLFPNAEIFRPFFDKLLPLLLSLTEDASFRSRQLALEALTLLKETACRRNCWNSDDLLKIYPEILKRLDDPTDSVRTCAVKALPIIFRNSPEEFKKTNFKTHHEMIIDNYLTHFDDDDADLQALIAECLKEMVYVGGKTTLIEKINKHKPLLRNQSGCAQVLADLDNLEISKV